MEEIFYNQKKRLINSQMTGIMPCRVNMFTPFIRNCSRLFFRILDHHQVEYALFAGSAIGLYRNRMNIPWVDDFDIIVMESQVPKLERLTTVFNEYGFYWHHRKGVNPLFSKQRIPDSPIEGMQIYYYPDHTKNIHYGGTFQCDIFYSHFDGNGLLKNRGRWGLYNEKSVQKKWVLPFKRCTFEHMSLPFFANYLEDIRHEYGDVDQAVIHVQHSRYKVCLNNNWKSCYREFESYVKLATGNVIRTMQSRSVQSRSVQSRKAERKTAVPVKTWLLDNFRNPVFVDLLKRIYESGAQKLVIRDKKYLKYILDIKFYLPRVWVCVYLDEVVNYWLVHLESVDEILVDNLALSNYLVRHYQLINLKRITLLSADGMSKMRDLPVLDCRGLRATPEPLIKVPEGAPSPGTDAGATETSTRTRTRNRQNTNTPMYGSDRSKPRKTMGGYFYPQLRIVVPKRKGRSNLKFMYNQLDAYRSVAKSFA